MSAFYGAPKPEADMIALIHHAVAAGVIFLDTSDLYGPHTDELLLGKALQDGVREKVQLVTKFGISPDCERELHKREVHGDPHPMHKQIGSRPRRLPLPTARPPPTDHHVERAGCLAMDVPAQAACDLEARRHRRSGAGTGRCWCTAYVFNEA